MSAPYVLATDLDGTLLAGSVAARRALRRTLESGDWRLVFVTGRGIASVRRILASDSSVPRPDWIVGDVGASVVRGEGGQALEPYQGRVRARWPGEARVRSALREFADELEAQTVEQEGRVSYLLRGPRPPSEALVGRVRALGCDHLRSGGCYFDVLPAGVSKASGLEELVRTQGWSWDRVWIAGDSLNDEALYRLPARAKIVVGGAESGLVERVVDLPGTVVREEVGVDAIVSTLEEADLSPRVLVGYHRAPRAGASPNGIIPALSSMFRQGLRGRWISASVASRPETAGLPIDWVPIDQGEWAEYFHHYCKESLWPAIMSREPALRSTSSGERGYRAYCRVNRRFAEKIAREASPGGLVWLHDYNLWLVPGHLKRLRPDLRVGLFHHTSIPESRFLRSLAAAEEIRRSLAALDWAGFQTRTFARRFEAFLAGSPLPAIGVHPLGIDTPTVEAVARRCRRRAPSALRTILAVERLDYAKGPIERIAAYERFLRESPSWRGRVRLRWICAPPQRGIRAYDGVRAAVERGVERVRATWATDGWDPVEYRPRVHTFDEVVSEYVHADTLWVTSLEDGMNLVSKEFVIAQSATQGEGALVLSERAGAAEELGVGAVLTDPTSEAGLVASLREGLALPSRERRARLAAMADRLRQSSLADWADGILRGIAGPARR